VRPDAAFFSEALGEFILPYDAVRTAADPDSALLDFLQSTYGGRSQWRQMGSRRAGMLAGTAANTAPALAVQPNIFSSAKIFFQSNMRPSQPGGTTKSDRRYSCSSKTQGG